MKSLRKLGYTHVQEAEDGGEAVRQLEISPDIDLIFMDMQMPVMVVPQGLTLLESRWMRSQQADEEARHQCPHNRINCQHIRGGKGRMYSRRHVRVFHQAREA